MSEEKPPEAAPPEEKPPEAPREESELFTIDGQKGWPVSRHLLVFTDRRLIIALVSGALTRFAAGRRSLWGVYEGSKIKKMKGKEIEELLSDKKTYTISYSEISSIAVEKGGALKAGSIKVNKTVGEPEKFIVKIKERIDDFERLLRPVFGGRLVTE